VPDRKSPARVPGLMTRLVARALHLHPNLRKITVLEKLVQAA